MRDSVLAGPVLSPPPPSADIAAWPPQPSAAKLPRQPVTPAEAVYTANSWQPPPATPALPPPTANVIAPSFVLAPRTVESTWYTRVDWYHWSETIGGANFVTENGPLFTLGYQRRVGAERFRAELFGSQVHYTSSLQFNDGTTEPIASQTDILGVRAEYDYLFQPDWPPPINFFIGIGTRAWVRNLPDFTDDFGNFIQGYQETWWTTYPYLGIESRHNESADVEFYGRGRVGLVAVTYEHLTLHEATLFPGPGVTAQLELGLRGDWLFLAGYAEVFTWRQSGEERDLVQPSSVLLTVGLKTGLSF
ncbi:MAG TPA: hypothetical protein VHD36_16540 [Pirellulales bacterium]|nr:hypothetical protein [Pirellulales bacterium]